MNLNEKYGDFSGSWSWGNTKSTDINHMGNIPGFGSVNLPTDGRSGIVNATGRTFGPSMRMIVSLGKNLRAWIVYPGGQTGNQGSVYYDHMVDDWVEGKYHEVIYLRSPAGSNDKIIGKTILKAGK
ncbi:MAG: penicillin acylase family protein [bacterium]|nr:penicillin acylase family protein [bacterium]